MRAYVCAYVVTNDVVRARQKYFQIKNDDDILR